MIWVYTVCKDLPVPVLRVITVQSFIISDDWGTQNTKVKHLLYVLKEARLYEAADYLAVNVLHGEKVSREPPEEAVLPVPEWEPKKGGKDADMKGYEKLAPVAMDQNKYAALNLNDKLTDVKKTNDKMYSLSNDLSTLPMPTTPNEGIIYQRIRSIDSGGDASVLLQDQCELESPPKSIENEETACVRPALDYLEKTPCEMSDLSGVCAGYKENSKPKREPCEMSDDSYPDIQSLEDLTSQIIKYNILRKITDNFNQTSLADSGRVIGTGGFGEVFLGIFPNGYKVAVKRLKDAEEKERQFETELDSLTKYRHENIVSLFGYSIDGPAKCLVYEYLCNGSLEDRLMRKNNTPPLSVPLRLSILKGTAKGIYFLNKQGIVHRDIKSPNVLLDENFVPKVGDFATVRGGAPGGSGVTSAMSTSIVIGTSAYLAPEALNFDVSTKLDSYSYGIIILEVLTGLPPLDQNREEKDLKSHVEENELCDILDESGGPWDDKVVTKLESMYERCTERRKKARVNIADIIEDLLAI